MHVTGVAYTRVWEWCEHKVRCDVATFWSKKNYRNYDIHLLPFQMRIKWSNDIIHIIQHSMISRISIYTGFQIFGKKRKKKRNGNLRLVSHFRDGHLSLAEFMPPAFVPMVLCQTGSFWKTFFFKYDNASIINDHRDSCPIFEYATINTSSMIVDNRQWFVKITRKITVRKGIS